MERVNRYTRRCTDRFNKSSIAKHPIRLFHPSAKHRSGALSAHPLHLSQWQLCTIKAGHDRLHRPTQECHKPVQGRRTAVQPTCARVLAPSEEGPSAEDARGSPAGRPRKSWKMNTAIRTRIFRTTLVSGMFPYPRVYIGSRLRQCHPPMSRPVPVLRDNQTIDSPRRRLRLHYGPPTLLRLLSMPFLMTQPRYHRQPVDSIRFGPCQL